MLLLLLLYVFVYVMLAASGYSPLSPFCSSRCLPPSLAVSLELSAIAITFLDCKRQQATRLQCRGTQLTATTTITTPATIAHDNCETVSQLMDNNRSSLLAFRASAGCWRRPSFLLLQICCQSDVQHAACCLHH